MKAQLNGHFCLHIRLSTCFLGHDFAPTLYKHVFLPAKTGPSIDLFPAGYPVTLAQRTSRESLQAFLGCTSARPKESL